MRTLGSMRAVRWIFAPKMRSRITRQRFIQVKLQRNNVKRTTDHQNPLARSRKVCGRKMRSRGGRTCVTIAALAAASANSACRCSSGEQV